MFVATPRCGRLQPRLEAASSGLLGLPPLGQSESCISNEITFLENVKTFFQTNLAMHAQILVAVGGAIGSLLRYNISLTMRELLPSYAASGTLIVNVLGSLAIGYLLGLSHEAKSVADVTRLFVAVGILGGLTTFSSLAYETMSLTYTHQAGIFAGLGHLTANLTLGLGAVWLGAWLARITTAS